MLITHPQNVIQSNKKLMKAVNFHNPPHPGNSCKFKPLGKNSLLAPYRGNDCEVLFSSLEVNGKNYSIVFPNVHGRLWNILLMTWYKWIVWTPRTHNILNTLFSSWINRRLLTHIRIYSFIGLQKNRQM